MEMKKLRDPGLFKAKKFRCLFRSPFTFAALPVSSTQGSLNPYMVKKLKAAQARQAKARQTKGTPQGQMTYNESG